MKVNATDFVDRLIGPFVDDALEQSTEVPTRERSRKTKAKGPQQAVNRGKKAETEMLYEFNFGALVREALERSTKTATHKRSRKPTANGPKKPASQRKKPGSASTQAQHRKRKNGR